MKILGRDKIQACIRKHSLSKKALQAWLSEAEGADWGVSQDIKDRYRSADFLADNRVIFNIKGNDFRLVIKVRYQGGTVIVEWVGTHADYNKEQF